MLTYEDALELKNAGFPQNTKSTHYSTTKGMEGELGISFGLPDIGSATRVAIPDLSELIEACGDDFEELKHYIGQREKVFNAKWLATGIEQEPWSSRSNCSGKGYTPEQAVKNLWISLNKK